MTAALPPIDNSSLPADVRAGTTADKDRYKSALAFERQLVEQRLDPCTLDDGELRRA